jgi:adenylylsulfate kinase-like enzyme
VLTEAERAGVARDVHDVVGHGVSLAGVLAGAAQATMAADREAARALHEEAGLDFIEAWVDTPLEECERRDPAGLYRRARAGELKDVTGIDAPYEEPEDPDVHLRAGEEPVERSVERILEALEARSRQAS